MFAVSCGIANGCSGPDAVRRSTAGATADPVTGRFEENTARVGDGDCSPYGAAAVVRGDGGLSWPVIPLVAVIGDASSDSADCSIPAVLPRTVDDCGSPRLLPGDRTFPRRRVSKLILKQLEVF